MCFGCQLATPDHLPFVYCKKCVDQLDPKDPTMNVQLLRLLCDDAKAELLAEVGYDEFFKLVEYSKQYRVVSDTLFRVFSDRVLEIPPVRKRKEIVEEIHNASGHVGMMKVYQMVKSLYYWPNLVDDCIDVCRNCVHCMKLKAQPQVLPLKPTRKFDRPFQCWSIDYLPKLPETSEGY